MRTVAVLTLAAASFASQQQTMEGSMQAPQRVRLRFIARSVLSAPAIVAVRGFVTPAAAQLTERVSVDSAGGQGNDKSFEPAISGDGRFVAFASTAPNLVPGDTNGTQDVFVHDRQTGATERVSVDSAGTQADLGSSSGAIAMSAGGRPPELSLL